MRGHKVVLTALFSGMGPDGSAFKKTKVYYNFRTLLLAKEVMFIFDRASFLFLT